MIWYRDDPDDDGGGFDDYGEDDYDGEHGEHDEHGGDYDCYSHDDDFDSDDGAADDADDDDNDIDDDDGDDDDDDDDDDPKYDWHLALVSLSTRRLSTWLWYKPVSINSFPFLFFSSLNKLVNDKLWYKPVPINSFPFLFSFFPASRSCSENDKCLPPVFTPRKIILGEKYCENSHLQKPDVERGDEEIQWIFSENWASAQCEAGMRKEGGFEKTRFLSARNPNVHTLQFNTNVHSTSTFGINTNVLETQMCTVCSSTQMCTNVHTLHCSSTQMCTKPMFTLHCSSVQCMNTNHSTRIVRT